MELPTTSSSSLLTPKLFFTTFYIPNSKLSISCPKLLSHSSRFKFYVHSRQPTKRPNYLRRKLVDPQKQVLHTPTFDDNVVKNDDFVQESGNIDVGFGIYDDGIDRNDNSVNESSDIDVGYGIYGDGISKHDNLVQESRNIGYDIRKNDESVNKSSDIGYEIRKNDNLFKESSNIGYGYGIYGDGGRKNDDLVRESRNIDNGYGIYGDGIRKSDDLVKESSNVEFGYGVDGVDKSLVGKEKILGDSELLSKLESWVQRCKADTEYWGFGTGHIFTVFQDSDGKVERVEVDEDEILRRSRTTQMALKGGEGGGGINVSSKILYAKELAREMEKGNNLIARDSPISRFVVSGSNSGHVDVIQDRTLSFVDRTSSFVSTIQRTTQMPGFVPRMKRIGFMVMIALMLVGAVKKFFIGGEQVQDDLTTIEKKMLKRKLKARAKEEEILNGTVEVIHKDVEVDNGHIVMPGLDREELMKDIMKAKGYNNELEDSKLLSDKNSMSDDFDNKIQEIKMMARHARETEKRDVETSETDEEDAQTGNLFGKNAVAQLHGNGHVNSPATIPNGNSGQIEIEDTPTIDMSSDNLVKNGEDLDLVAQLHGNGHVDSPAAIPNGYSGQIEIKDTPTIDMSYDNLVKNGEDLDSTSPILKSNVNTSLEIGKRDQALHPPGTSLADKQPTRDGVNLDKESPTKKLRVIRSVEEAREYLSRKHAKQDVQQENRPTRGESVDVATATSEIEVAEPMSQNFEKVGNHIGPSSTQPNSTDSSKYGNFTGDRYVLSSESYIREDGERKQTGGNNGSILFSGHKGSLCDQPSETPISILSGEEGTDEDTSDEMKEQDLPFPPSKLDESSQPHSISVSMDNSEAKKPISIQNENNHSQNVEEDNMIDLAGHEHSSTSAGHSPSPRTDKWLEKNFHELEPVIKKMAEGFRGNYMVAKETTKQDINSEDNTLLLKSEGDSGELSWMKDEKLRDIVFRVRDNELAGREPFHQIDNESKLAFFNGLENKVEEENKKLLNLHKFLHLNIENLDYGADGISLYDPLEKIIPRWKGPPISDFLSEVIEDRMSVVGEENIINGLSQNSSERSSDLSIHDTSSSAPSSISDPSSRVKMGIPKSSKTIIEGSDGSTKVGKKSGKEFWQHTKKWSQGFLSSYNEETDPEMKAVMKDIGKDLDRWITEKEIQEAAELMDKLPEGNQKFIKSKVDKVKREMELFGPQAVVSKYREYADVNEEDYLWWLDLPYVLCIELYMKEDGEQKMGLYSLEMAPDLELEPKPSHVIAFEDAGDCKSLCYIVQHHLEMIGNGNAFVVARPPKDAFREAKESGFSVTVIRKGELQLNVDQPLEEVEDLIIEIGSKVYHDKIMKERSVDMSGIMKGLVAPSKPSRRRRTKRRLKIPTRH